MTNRLLRTLCRMYEVIYSDKPFKNTKTVAFLIYHNKVVGFGVNSDKTSPMQNLYRLRTDLAEIENFIDKEHAEVNCLRKIGKTFDIDFDKAEIVIISKRCDKSFRLARPCSVCMEAIKDFGIHRVWYTNREQWFSYEYVE